MNFELGTLTFLVTTGIFQLYALFYPWNWVVIKTRHVGVIKTLNRIEKNPDLVLHEGPAHVWSPFQSVRQLPIAEFIIEIEPDDVPTAAPNSVLIKFKVAVAAKWDDPIRVMMSVVDLDPEEEVKKFIRGEIRKLGGEFTIDQHLASDTTTQLSEILEKRLQANELFIRWGFRVTKATVYDIEFPLVIHEASATRIMAKAQGDADLEKAEAQQKAMGLVGAENYVLFQWFEALKDGALSGAFRTFVNVGGGLLDTFSGLLGSSKDEVNK